MQEPQQPSSSILTTAYNLFIRGTRFFANLCARRSEKKRQAYYWEERLAYVGEEVEDEDDEINDDELDMQLERSCGVYPELRLKKQEPRSRHIFTQKVHTAFPNMIGLIISILKFFAWLLGSGALGHIGGSLAGVCSVPPGCSVLQRFAMA
ncbi:hypothetical protein KCV07_g9460, partial [Aureobasidium melanogenum]